MLVTKENLFFVYYVPGNREHAKEKTHAAYSKMFVNIFFKRVANYLKDNKHKLEAHSFPQALLSETCLHLGTDKVHNNNRMYFHAK